MHLAPDTEEALDFTVALSNTVPGATRSGTDELADAGALRSLLTAFRYSGRVDGDERELREVQSTRARLRRAWTLARDDAAAEANAMLREAGALPFLTRHDGIDWHLHATEPDAPLAERMRVEVSLALIDVIRTDEMDRLRSCAAPDCDGILVDLSRNGSKRFCSIRCGNRMNQLAYRDRRSAD